MKKKIRLLISLLILVFLFGCTEEDPNEGTLKVIENIVTYPNEELFDANLLLLPYDAVEERKESAERTESNWSNAVEEYF
ncbi:MAG: hypothetical protein IIY11_04250, partial [Clostridia bacterium]|nr:hypothetical protein [Clostridia bacterium]